MSPNSPLFRGLTESRVSRRQLLRGAGAGIGALALSELLAACSIAGTAPTATSSTGTDWTTYWASQKKHGVLNFANWPLYIDEDKGKSPSLELFTKTTGIKVNYKEVIQDDPSFYAKISPELVAHQYIGYDLIVITNGWELTELIDNNMVLQLDHSQLPNFSLNADRSVLNPNYDPDALHSLVWQTGFTGLAYNEKLTGRPITSFKDLLDPKFAGHIGMMSDNTELGSAALLALGIEPATSTHADWEKAAAWAKQIKVLNYYDQSYIDKLENGDIWISQAWSGDIFQANAGGHADLKFVTPKEGQMVWHDNMMIPAYAENPVDALQWMNFYYTPKVAGMVEDWVNYVCPVPGAKQYIQDVIQDPAVASSPLVFPTPAMEAASHEFYVYKNYADYQAWNQIFNAVIHGG